MKKFFSIGMGMALFALALVACNKQETTPASNSKTTMATANKPYTTEGKVFVDWNTKCTENYGSCLEEVIIRPQVRDQLVNIIPFITNGNEGAVHTAFATQRDLLSEVFPAALIDGVLDGSYTLSYHASPSINRNWFVFSAGNTVVNYVATPMN